jgi:hypothetical protein
MYKRPKYDTLINRIKEKRHFIQVLAGPRQVGKTTLARQVLESLKMPSHYASADDPTLRDLGWIVEQWEIGRLRASQENSGIGALLILDEVQKIPQWSDYIKKLWDEDTYNKINLKVIILGSSTLLINKGLDESLAGRFEVLPITHWSFKECRDAFGWNLEEYFYFGGYPGGEEFIKDEERWSQYILNSLIENSISRDIMLMTRVNKPALLRRLFELGCHYSSQILSYQKMLGQLQDAGNTTTLAHYLDLLNGAGLMRGIQKYTSELVIQKSSSPKLQALNTALISAQGHKSFKEAQQDREYWGRLVESAVGAHLINSTIGTRVETFYWREGNKEVDFVVRKGDSLIAIEVKSGMRRESLPGFQAFSQKFNPQTKLLVGGSGIPIEDFLLNYPDHWF